MGARDEFCGVGEVPSTSFVDNDLCSWEQLGKIPDASSMIEVDVGDDDCCQIVWIDPERGELGQDDGRRTRGTGLDEARFAALDEVAGSNAFVAPHARVDHEHVVAEIDDIGCTCPRAFTLV